MVTPAHHIDDELYILHRYTAALAHVGVRFSSVRTVVHAALSGDIPRMQEMPIHVIRAMMRNFMKP